MSVRCAVGQSCLLEVLEPIYRECTAVMEQTDRQFTEIHSNQYEYAFVAIGILIKYMLLYTSMDINRISMKIEGLSKINTFITKVYIYWANFTN